MSSSGFSNFRDQSSSSHSTSLSSPLNLTKTQIEKCGRDMSKRGLNPEEKRTKTLEFFHENDSFFTLKDLLKLVPKAKGVVAQSVEETVKSLVDDGMVHIEKVGTINLFWSFSSESSLATSRALDTLRAEKERLEKERIDLQSQLEKSAADRSANEERENNLREIKVLRQDISDIKDKLKLHSINDPHVVEEKMRICELYKSGAEIWTENLSIMMSHCRNQYQIDRYKFCGQFELEEDFEEALEKIESSSS
ncbi:hypothetical protein Pst134EA_033000 [Puccinia striiformis f. sp. tritici]|uniref:uncharacterized protein n=2 Tax=Puccinia striiformis f. sp. tritici TaxID=168172 RepID=UPI0020087C9D|nr:uncharacterized protein Pst134EA_033000 [Puccinia striiformis f. sp. tritici]KAH9440822.1 hypothetical protein Pst134EA_033000 [Puccinia striiformis f. sp. tritici]